MPLHKLQLRAGFWAQVNSIRADDDHSALVFPDGHVWRIGRICVEFIGGLFQDGDLRFPRGQLCKHYLGFLPVGGFANLDGVGVTLKPLGASW